MESIEDQHQNSISQLQLQSQQQSEVQKQREKLGFQADLDPTDSDTASGVNHELTEKIINQELQKLYINDEDHQHAVASVEQKETSENFGFQNAMSSVHFDDDGVNRELTEKIINFHKVEINDEGLRFPEASPEREEFSEIKLQNFSSNVDVVGKEQDRKSKLKDDGEESRNDLESADLEANEVKEEGLDQVEAAKDESGADHDSDERSESENGSENENEKEREEGVGEYENVNEESESGTGPVSVFKDGTYRRYPIRPDAEDCPYYMKTGTCKFGSHCKFNHPPRKKNQFPKEKLKQKEDNPERPGQVECKYYLTSGGCKYGRACKFNHSRAMTPVAAILELNFLGLPIRLGEKECPYFMRTGSCKYGSNCRFNHPDPTAAGGSDPPSGLGNSAQGASHSSMSSLSPPGHLSESSPFVPVMFPSTQRLLSPNPGMNGYQVPVYPTSERSLPTPPAFAMTNPATETKFYPLHQQQVPVDEFPERPGQPECSYYMKTGDCKYGSGCKFHHPKSRVPKTAPCVLSDRGLPLRPGQNICTHYSRYGICKFGPACRYNHPETYVDSDSSVGSGADQPPHFSNSASADVPRMARSGHGRKPLVQQHV